MLAGLTAVLICVSVGLGTIERGWFLLKYHNVVRESVYSGDATIQGQWRNTSAGLELERLVIVSKRISVATTIGGLRSENSYRHSTATVELDLYLDEAFYNGKLIPVGPASRVWLIDSRGELRCLSLTNQALQRVSPVGVHAFSKTDYWNDEVGPFLEGD